MLLEVVTKKIQFAKKDNELEAIRKDFVEVLRYIALNPNATDIRARLTAPSLPWLATVRRLPPSEKILLKAWLGHPTLASFDVLKPRGELKPILEKHGGLIITTETPQPLSQSDIAIILSHGRRGLFRGFVGVDDVGKFATEELANWFGECKCVILFVCNAGRNEAASSSNETFVLLDGY